MNCTKENSFCHCLIYASNALARSITKMADEEFGKIGLASSYAFLLMTVNKHNGIQPTEISQIMMLAPSTVTRLITKMESQGLLERRIEGKNTYVHPTEASLAMDSEIKLAWKRVYDRYTDKLGMSDSGQLADMVYEAAVKLS